MPQPSPEIPQLLAELETVLATAEELRYRIHCALSAPGQRRAARRPSAPASAAAGDHDNHGPGHHQSNPHGPRPVGLGKGDWPHRRTRQPGQASRVPRPHRQLVTVTSR